MLEEILRFKLRGQSERLVANGLSDSPASNALNANPHAAYFTVRKGSLNVLKVRCETSLGNASNLGTDAAEILCFTTCFHLVSNGCYFAANCTGLGHGVTFELNHKKSGPFGQHITSETNQDTNVVVPGNGVGSIATSRWLATSKPNLLAPIA